MALTSEQQLKQALLDLMIDYPFYGSLAMHLPLTEMPEWMEELVFRAQNRRPTFCTDYKRIYYSKEFADSLERDEKRWVIAHEVLHNCFLHNIRVGNRNPRRWNKAADFAINAILKKDFGFVLPKALYSEKFEDMNAEKIYALLPEMEEDSKGLSQGSFQKGDIKIEVDKYGNMKVNGVPMEEIGGHMKAPASESEREDIEKEMQVQIAQAMHTAKQRGKMPGGMKVFLEELLNPKLSWQNLLRHQVMSVAKSDFDWRRPNRRHAHDDMYMPSMTGESLGVMALIVDVSGSTAGKDQLRFFSELSGLLQQYDVELHVIVCDVEIQSHDVYHQGDTIKKEYKGMGGTELSNGWKYLEKQGINPELVICFTDGWTSFDFKSKWPVLWVVTKDGVDLDKIPFGVKVKMDD